MGGSWQPLIPIFTALLALLFGMESFHAAYWFGWTRLLGLLVGLGGAVVMLGLNNLGAQSSNAVLGNLFLLGNCMSFAIYVLVQRPLLREYVVRHSKCGMF